MSDEAHQPAAPAHDRGHDRAQFRREDAERLYPAVRNFTAFLGRSPDTATAEDLRRFQLHQAQAGRASAEHQRHGGGAALLLHGDLDRPEMARPADVRARAAEDPAWSSARRKSCGCSRPHPGLKYRPR